MIFFQEKEKLKEKDVYKYEVSIFVTSTCILVSHSSPYFDKQFTFGLIMSSTKHKIQQTETLRLQIGV